MPWRRLIRPGLPVSANNSVAILQINKDYLSPGSLTIEWVAFSKGRVHYGEDMRFRILKNILVRDVTRPVATAAIHHNSYSRLS